jgi:quinol monooxygenase YgiN
MANIYSHQQAQQLSQQTRRTRGGGTHQSTSSSSLLSSIFTKRRNTVPPQNSIKSFTIVTIIALLVGIVIILAAAVTSSSSSSAHLLSTTTMEQSSHINENKPFSLMVKLRFTELQHQQHFLRDITPLCQYIQEHESTTTIAYEVLLSDQDPLQVLIIERYVDKENAFLQIHKTSAPFLEFRTKLQTMQNNQYVTIDGSSYYDSGIGYIHQ